MPFLKQITVSGGMTPCWLVTTDVKRSVTLHLVSFEELQCVNATPFIPFPKLLHCDPDKNISVAILWYKYGTNIESATVKLISLHLNVSLKTTRTHTHIHNASKILHVLPKSKPHFLERG